MFLSVRSVLKRRFLIITQEVNQESYEKRLRISRIAQ